MMPRAPRRALPRLVMLLLGLLVLVLLAAVGLLGRGGAGAPPAGQGALASGLRPGGLWVTTGFTVTTDALLPDPRAAGGVVAGTSDGVWTSADGGRTWRRDGLAGQTIFSLDAGGSAGMVAGAGDGSVYGRAATGRWARLGPAPATQPIFSVAVAPGGHVVLAGTFGTLYQGRRAAGGWRWQPVAHDGGGAVTSIVWAPGSSRRAYASVFASGPPVLTTGDGGVTWRPAVAGLPPGLPSEALLMPDTAARLILTTMGEGVWLRAGEGRWQDISAGLPARHAMPLAVDAAGIVYGGTMGSGVYTWRPGGSWQRLGRGLDGAAYTVLALTVTRTARPTLLAGTALGIYRYVPAAGG